MVGCAYSTVRSKLIEAGIPLGNHPSRFDIDTGAASRDRVDAFRRAKQMFMGGEPLVPGDPAWRYLASRCIEPLPHETVTFRVARSPVQPWWNLIAAIVDPWTLDDPAGWQAVGVQTLSIDVMGVPERLTGGKKRRSSLGTRRACGVAIGAPQPSGEVVLGEGVETTWAAMRLLDRPFGLASLSATGLWQIHLPPGTATVHLAVDNDEAGQVNALRAAQRFASDGLRVHTYIWPGEGTDAADVWLQTKRGMGVG